MSPLEQKVRLHPLQSMSSTSAGSRGAVPKQKLAEAAEKETKVKIFNLLAQLDPSRIKKYNQLKK